MMENALRAPARKHLSQLACGVIARRRCIAMSSPLDSSGRSILLERTDSAFLDQARLEHVN